MSVTPDKVIDVDTETGEITETAVVPMTDHTAAINAAAEAALAAPAIPGRDEFLALAMEARILAGSSLVPRPLRGKPHDVLLVLLTGRDLGIPQTSALRKVYVVDGQPSLAPQLLLARIRQLGLGRIVPHEENTDRWAAAIPLDSRGQVLGPPSIFTWEEAQRAGLVDWKCEPSDHAPKCHCKDNWKHYPRRMLWWRAAGYCADDYFPEVSHGLYSPDELGQVTDADGHPIDPATIDVPEGYGPSTKEDPVADADVLVGLRDRAAALPEDLRIKLRERWDSHERLRGYHLGRLPARLVALAEGLIASLEAQNARSAAPAAQEEPDWATLGWDDPEAARGAHTAYMEGMAKLSDAGRDDVRQFKNEAMVDWPMDPSGAETMLGYLAEVAEQEASPEPKADPEKEWPQPAS